MAQRGHVPPPVRINLSHGILTTLCFFLRGVDVQPFPRSALFCPLCAVRAWCRKSVPEAVFSRWRTSVTTSPFACFLPVQPSFDFFLFFVFFAPLCYRFVREFLKMERTFPPPWCPSPNAQEPSLTSTFSSESQVQDRKSFFWRIHIVRVLELRRVK